MSNYCDHILVNSNCAQSATGLELRHLRYSCEMHLRPSVCFEPLLEYETSDMPGPLAKVRVLMLGSDEPLLRTRAKVLDTIGCETRVVCGEEEANQELTSGKQKPQLVILCHTADESHIERVRIAALRAGIPTYSVERMVPPQQLIDDVKRVLKNDAGAHRRTTRA